VAWDRPYKKSVPVERALQILNEEAAAGKVDEELLRVFVEAGLFELRDYWDRPEMKGRRKGKA